MKIILFFMFFAIGFVFAAELDFRKEVSSLPSIGTHKLSQNETGDLILIDFWASWCDPCKESFPYYEKLIKAQTKKKVLFISVNLDDKTEKAETFLNEFPQSHFVVWDKEKKFMAKLGFESIPYLLVLDKEWNTLEKIKGFNDRSKKILSKYLTQTQEPR